MRKPKIIAYLKPYCGWSNGVRAILGKYGLPYEERDIINNPQYYAEMVAKSGQHLQPTLDIDGTILADISGEELEKWLIENNIVTPSQAEVSVPINAPCTDVEHERMTTQPGWAPVSPVNKG